MTLPSPRAALALGFLSALASGASATTLPRPHAAAFVLEVDASTEDLSCNGAVGGVCDGAFVLSIAAGTAPYTLTIAGGGDAGLPASTEISAAEAADYRFDDLCPGTFAAVVTDAEGTSFDLGEQTIAEPTPITFALDGMTPSTGEGVADGRLDVTVAGGTPPYAFAWSSGADTEDAADLTEGTYRLTVTDAAGCVLVTDGLSVNRLRIADAVVTDASCGERFDGAVDLTVLGGNGAYAFAWSDGSDDEDLRTAAAGTYTVTVTDVASGASLEAAYEVGPRSDLAVAAEVTTDFNGFGVGCAGAAEGGVRAVVTGGVEPIEIAWDNGAASAELADLTAGSYEVAVRDPEGCVARARVEVTEPQPLAVTLVADTIACPGEGEANLTARATGGVGEVTYAWNTGADGQRLVDLASGDYAVSVTDANGCTDADSAEVFVPTELLVEDYVVTPATTVSPGGVALEVSGGQQPYRVRWGNRVTAPGVVALDDLPFGAYEIVVSDYFGCDRVTLDVRVPNGDLACLDATDVLTPGNLDGLNDAFRVNCIADFPDNTLEVFSRWGERVYGGTGYDNESVVFRGLDAGGEPLREGAYYYVLRYRDADGADRVRQGAITVVR